MTDSAGPKAPDLTLGVAADSLSSGGTLLGRVGDDDALLARAGDRFFAVGAHCTHYHGPLAEGLVVDDTVRCPLHHACFSLETGEALRAPALDPLACWRVERRGAMVFVREKISELPPVPRGSAGSSRHPSSIMVVGGGAAGLAAADMLRREGYEGPIVLVSADEDPPVDRPNLSKDYLAGEAQDDWIPMWPSDAYAQRHIELLLRSRVSSIDPGARTVLLENGSRRDFGALLIATGADPVRFPIPGADSMQVFYLRSFADSRAIVERARTAKHVVVVGASFIGLEVSAALRTRGVAARIMLGRRERFDAVPFFWSQHYDVTIRYVGHAERWDTVTVSGSLDARDASVSFMRGGRKLAVATVSRDRENLQVELELEQATASQS